MKEIKDMTQAEKDQEAYTALEKALCNTVAAKLVVRDRLPDAEEELEAAQRIIGKYLLALHLELSQGDTDVVTLSGKPVSPIKLAAIFKGVQS
jgi:hypothetical protein